MVVFNPFLDQDTIEDDGDPFADLVDADPLESKANEIMVVLSDEE